MIIIDLRPLIINCRANACFVIASVFNVFEHIDWYGNIREYKDIIIISVSTYVYIQSGGYTKAVAVKLVAAAVHPSAYDNRHNKNLS